jgi:hypothetical protein
MKFLVLGFLFVSAVVIASEDEYVLPIHAPEEAETLIIEYLRRDRPQIDLTEYNYESLSYTYMQGFWTASFECKKVELSCHFGVQMSNDKNPEFRFYPGI